MKTKIIKINENETNKFTSECFTPCITMAGEILKAGGVVAFPTETVYGLGADALNPEAARKIYEAKGRPSDNPLIIHISEKENVDRVAADISQKARKIMEKFWPGPITLVMKKQYCVPTGTTGGLETVAVRFPNHKLACEIITAGGGFICAPSANTSGRPSPTKGVHVEEDMNHKIDMIISCDNVSIGVESTIIDTTIDPPVILRPGAITKKMLEDVIGTVLVDKAIVSQDCKEAPRAPGMKYRHYAPKAPLIIVESDVNEKISCVQSIIKSKEALGMKVGVMASEETAKFYQAKKVISLGQAGSLEIASTLYDALRAFDDIEVDVIISEEFSDGELGSAIMNRLRKAAVNK